MHIKGSKKASQLSDTLQDFNNEGSLLFYLFVFERNYSSSEPSLRHCVLFKFVFFREQSLSACAAIRKITEEAESCSSERNEVRGERQKSRADPVAENYTQGAAVFVGNSQPLWFIINCSIFIMRSQLYHP